jgi:PAS domain S-box-containing protein
MSMMRRCQRWAAAIRDPAERVRTRTWHSNSRPLATPLGKPRTAVEEPVEHAAATQALADLLEQAPFGFALLDAKGRYVVVNRQLAALNGVAAYDHLDRRPSELHNGGAIDEACVERVLRTGHTGTTRAMVPDATTGGERYLMTSCYPVRSASGRVAGVGAMALDITDQELTRRRAEQLLQFSGLLGVATSIDALAHTIVRFVSSTLRARCAVGLVDGERLRIAAVQGYTPEVCERWMREGFALSDPRPMTAAVRGCATVEIPSVADALPEYSALGPERVQTGDATVIAIPIRDRTEEFVASAVLRVSWPYQLQLEEDGWTTLQTLVSTSELALTRISDNARNQAALISARVAEETDVLMERRRIAVEVLQRAALPAQLPDVEGIVLHAVYRPATTAIGVGGDWYDALALRDNRLGLVIADVAGHGEEAASFMVQVRNALRAMAIEHEQPHMVLERINAVALELRDPRAPFITCCYAVLDPVARTLSWSSAGHFDPLIVDAGGVTYFASAPHGPPLAVISAPQYTTTVIELTAGDRVVLFTDGLVERRGEPIDDGLQRLARQAADARHAKPDQCLDSLLEIVEEQLDDLAVICADLVSVRGDAAG